MLRTEFWRRAAASLPPQVRARYALELQGAERVDLAMRRAVDACAAAREAIARAFRARPLEPGVEH